MVQEGEKRVNPMAYADISVVRPTVNPGLSKIAGTMIRPDLRRTHFSAIRM
jgi:hypothetical protein